MDAWNTTFLLGFGLFSGAFAVSFREGKLRNTKKIEVPKPPSPALPSAALRRAPA